MVKLHKNRLVCGGDGADRRVKRLKPVVHPLVNVVEEFVIDGVGVGVRLEDLPDARHRPDRAVEVRVQCSLFEDSNCQKLRRIRAPR